MRALVLSGGASKGAYQVGVLKHLMGDLETHYDLICGISVGAINGAWLSMFPEGQEKPCIEQLEDLWRGLRTKDVYVSWVNLPGFLSYLGFLVAPFKSSIYNSRPIEELLEEKFDPKLIEKSGKQLKVGAVSLNSGLYKLFDQDHPKIVQAVMASAAFPTAFRPVEIEGEFWLDGGIKEVTPLKAAIQAGATEIDVVITASSKRKPKNYTKAPKLFTLAPRVLSLMSDEVLDNDVNRALELNNLIKDGAIVPGKKYIPIRVFRPEQSLTPNSLEFEQKYITPMIAKGYEVAKEVTGQ